MQADVKGLELPEAMLSVKNIQDIEKSSRSQSQTDHHTVTTPLLPLLPQLPLLSPRPLLPLLALPLFFGRCSSTLPTHQYHCLFRQIGGTETAERVYSTIVWYMWDEQLL